MGDTPAKKPLHDMTMDEICEAWIAAYMEDKAEQEAWERLYGRWDGGPVIRTQLNEAPGRRPWAVFRVRKPERVGARAERPARPRSGRRVRRGVWNLP